MKQLAELSWCAVLYGWGIAACAYALIEADTWPWALFAYLAGGVTMGAATMTALLIRQKEEK